MAWQVDHGGHHWLGGSFTNDLGAHGLHTLTGLTYTWNNLQAMGSVNAQALIRTQMDSGDKGPGLVGGGRVSFTSLFPYTFDVTPSVTGLTDGEETSLMLGFG